MKLILMQLSSTLVRLGHNLTTRPNDLNTYRNSIMRRSKMTSVEIVIHTMTPMIQLTTTMIRQG